MLPGSKRSGLEMNRLLISVGLAVGLVLFLHQMDWLNTLPVEEQRSSCVTINNPGLWKKPLDAFNRHQNDPENPIWNHLGKETLEAENIVLAAYQNRHGRRIDLYLTDQRRTFTTPIRLRAEFERLTQVESHLPGGLNSCCFVKIRRKTTRGQVSDLRSLSGSTFLLNIGQIESVEELDPENTLLKMKGFRDELLVGTRKVKEQIVPKIKDYWTCKGQPDMPGKIIH